MRAETLQEVPISVSVVDDETIESIGAFRMHDLNGIIPNVMIDEGVISNSLSVRGISSFNNQGFEQSVGFFRDGIYIGKGHMSRLPFMDMERIEVLRGPQGTLFGKNTIAGAVSGITKNPTDEFEAGIRTQLALDEDEDYEFEGYVSGPLTENLRGRIAARFRDSDGYLTNIAQNNRTEPQREEYAIRATLEWDINENVTAIAKYEHTDWQRLGRSLQIASSANPGIYQDAVLDDFTNVTNSANQANIEGSPVAFLDDFPGFVGSDREHEYSNSDADIASIKITGDMGELTIESNTGYAAYKSDEFFDGEFGPLPQITNVPDEDYEQFSQEFRILSPTDGPLAWIAGMYYENNDYIFNEQIDVAAPAMIPGPGGLVPGPNFTKFVTAFQQDEETIAGFGTLSYDITDAFTITGGIRYSNIKKDATQSQNISTILPIGNTVPLDPTDPANALIFGFWGFVGITPHTQTDSRSTDLFEWSLNLEYDFELNGSHSTYFTIAEGAKSGGFDARSTSVSPAFEFDDEDARTYEFGLKSLWLDGALQWNWALFRTEYSDLQQSVFNGALSFIVQNAAEATINGIETDLTWQITDELSFWGNLGWLDFEYDSYPTGPCTVTQSAAVAPAPCFQNLAGLSAPKAPEFNGAFGIGYKRPFTSTINFYSSLTLMYTDDYFQDADLDPTTLENAYVKIDGQIGIESNDGKWSIGILGKNLTDKLTCSQRGDTPLNNFTYSCLTNPPQTFYLQANYNFN
jgi:outer membrane receptor protein involved in Fe transport